jgi:hypothetical protein
MISMRDGTFVDEMRLTGGAGGAAGTRRNLADFAGLGG